MMMLSLAVARAHAQRQEAATASATAQGQAAEPTQPVKPITFIGHDGGTGGFSDSLWLDPQGQRAVVLLADTVLHDLAPWGPLVRSLFDPAAPVPPPRRATPISSVQAAALVGEYTLSGSSLRIWRDAGSLMAQAAGQAAWELMVDDQGNFYPAGFSARLTPTLQDGVMQRLVRRQGGAVLEGQRLAPATGRSVCTGHTGPTSHNGSCPCSAAARRH